MSVNTSTSIISSNGVLRYYLFDFWREMGDHRTADYPLIRDGPWLMLTIMTSYYLFVHKIGPSFMKSREPFELRSTLLIYNSAMVAANAYFFIQALQWIKYGSALFDFRFPTKDDHSVAIQQQIWSFYLYYCTKFVDLLDTVFFVLRKKYSQITTLHVYHHTAVPVLGWMTFWYRFNVPSITLFALLNSLVHMVMYSYYALSALGPRIQPFLWWKRYITQLQLLQFCAFGAYGTLVKLLHQGTYPSFAFWTAYSQSILFFYMFIKFYFKSYCSRKSAKLDNKTQ
ncbi:elongation of very long chain fatty acids protein 4-like [Oppia nitens]|uniref:elongation of very long chain fatty acids protein 4-like n=1 Tax=Oppia nitens TaxID=1686743 RepID=UPI0023D9C8FB|nr:elongation of very long chain fatty acids protein 4-like [Oppia nitens]